MKHLAAALLAITLIACGSPTSPVQSEVEVTALYWPSGAPVGEDEVGELIEAGWACVLKSVSDRGNFVIRVYECWP